MPTQLEQINDTIVEKTGKHMEGASWIFDHSVGKNVFGMQLATCTFSGKYGFYPISADIYRRLESLEKEKKEEEYITKIEMQIQTIGKCISAGLNFHTVVGDIWYFTKDINSFAFLLKIEGVCSSIYYKHRGSILGTTSICSSS